MRIAVPSELKMKLLVALLIVFVGYGATLELKHKDVNSDKNFFDKLWKRTRQPCLDISTQCRPWALLGECDANPNYMHVQCRKSCGICRTECWDKHCSCPTLAAQGHCQYGSQYYDAMAFLCGESCNFC